MSVASQAAGSFTIKGANPGNGADQDVTGFHFVCYGDI